VAAVTRIIVVDRQPAVRAGLTVLLRSEPGFVPVGAAGTIEEAEALLEHHPDVVLLEHRLAGGDGLQLCRRIKARTEPPLVVLYTLEPDPSTILAARVAGADGVVDKAADPVELFEALRRVARGGTALPPLSAEEFDDAARRADPEDLALLAMLVDRTSQADVAETLRLDRRRLARRIERLLGRLRARPADPAAV
jgi:DNA-binding NarL/FixJ family response regulator